MKKDPIIYLEHIFTCIVKIEEYTKDMNEAGFLQNGLVQDAVIRNFEVIGEATKQLHSDFRAEHPSIAWKKIAGMRDKLIHNYIGVDLWAVWAVVEHVIPELRRQLTAIIDNKNTRNHG